MRIDFNVQNPTIIKFKGVREDRNTVSQLKNDNAYSLNEPNQRRINIAIDNLAKQKGEENIRFLLNVGENLKYQTNIINGKKTKNDWRAKLKGAAEKALDNSDPVLADKYQPEIARVFTPKPLNKDDKYIISKKNSILKRISDEKERSEIETNLDYFITSTETPILQKRYIMKRLDYFMSPDYKINPQLSDKKTKVLSEMINDLVINTPESKVPNIKAINQKTHGMCAAISIVRKAVAYEDKQNYVDSIISELDDNDTMEVYDIQNLGSGKKVPIKKTYIDFDYAQERGYRIVDASTLQWMNIGGMYGAQNESLNEFNSFDKDNFDAFHDSFFLKRFSDEELVGEQSYYQSLVKAKDVIGGVKSSKIKSKEHERNRQLNINNAIKDAQKLNDYMREDLREILPEESRKDINKIMTNLLSLEKPLSDDIKKNTESLRKYSYIPNEEQSQKEKKVKAYLSDNYSVNVDDTASENRIKSIVDNITRINTLENNLTKGSSLRGQIAKARRLYEAESSYRATKLFEFINPERQIPALIAYNIPDTETRIIRGFDKVIDRIEKKDDKVLLNHFAKEFGTTPENKEEIIEKLNLAKESMDIVMTSGMDKLYQSLGYGSRYEFLLKDISDTKKLIMNGEEDELSNSAALLSLKPKKDIVLKEYDKIEKKLKDNPYDEKVYIETLNRLGCKDQSTVFINLFQELANIINSDYPEKEQLMSNFMEANGLTKENSPEELYDVINNIGNEYNIIADGINAAGNMLEIKDENGDEYFTVSANRILEKKLENDGILVPSKTMKKLQTRFSKIDKIRSSDEFASRQGKISQPELYKLTKEEALAVKSIDKKINSMYSDVTRNLNEEFKDLRTPLEKLASYVGTNSGEYWVLKEGDSGLFDAQQIKIYEQLTDRPYYALSNIEEAVNIIKNGTYSGISGSSVFHDRMGSHAQYIADIKPIKNKDVLFHDNTWGASEHENTWVDSEGLTRTDYSDRRGGEIGYITDDAWRNGNYVENLTDKKGHVSADTTENKVYKKINPSSQNEYDFALMRDIIVQGESPDYHDIAGSIKDTIFLPDTRFIGSLEKHAESMTKNEIKKSIFRVKTAGRNYHSTYDKIIERIVPTTFNKGITTEDEYNNLPNDDIVKVSFEKAAIRSAYNNYEITTDLTKANTVDDLNKIKNKQHDIAFSNFEYSFGKTNDALMYVGLEHNQEIVNLLINSFKNHKLDIEPEKYTDILKNVVVFSKEETKGLNGSLKNTIDTSVAKASKQFDENVPDSETSQEVKKEYLEGLRSILEKNTYFNKDDLNNNSKEANGIKKWIDRKFEPISDEEFVKIYNNIQDMTKEEFNKITKDVSDTELGIKKTNGFEILKKVILSNEENENLLRNTLFFDSYTKDMNMSKTKSYYKYDKLERKNSGSLYVGTRTFDDLYRTMYMSLSGLTYGKMFNKYKDQNYRKYGVLPAYPKVNLEGTKGLSEKTNEAINLINQAVSVISSQKTSLFDIKLIDQLDNYTKNIPENKVLTKMERDSVKSIAKDFITANYQDPDLNSALDSAYNIMEIKQGSTLADYKDDLSNIIDTIRALENINTSETLEAAAKNTSKAMDNYIKTLIAANIPDKYQRILYEDLNKLIKLKIHSENVESGRIENKDLINLQQKINDSSISPKDKTQTDKFIRLMSYVNKAKIMKNSDNLNPETLAKQIDKINDYSDKYVERFIEPDKQPIIKTLMNDWLSKELVGTREKRDDLTKIEEAEQKFTEDFLKYHLLNNPLEILDGFLLYNASDSSKNNKKDFYKVYLQEALELSKFIELQDTMMEAINTGNAAQVKSHFKDFNVPTTDGSTLNMDADEAVYYMVESLLLENNTKTAKMFVEKFGLGDRIMSIEKKELKALNPKEKIDNIVSIIKTSGTIAAIAKEEFDKLNSTINASQNYKRDISETKKAIINRTQEFAKNPETKKEINKYLKALDKGRKFIYENPGLPRNILMSQKMNEIFEVMNETMNKEIQSNQSYLNNINQVYKFLLDLHLPEYSKGYKIQQELREDFENLADYNNDALNNATVGLNDIILAKNVVIS